MDEGRRKRKSFWDAEEQYSTDDAWHLSPSRADTNSLKPKDQSRRSSGETHHVAEKIENVYKDGRDVSQIKELGRDNSQYKSMSPAFDGWVQKKRNYSPEESLGQTHRHMERGRSRSRERGRSRGRSRSRSWSRERGRDRGSGWHRSRSRSRSRNQKMVKGRSRSRSRSPFHDHRRESYAGWNDRSGSGVSSQICRDFPTGNCRRGSRCRFLHPENISRIDGDFPEKELAERAGSRMEHGHVMRYSDTEGPRAPRVSDVTYGEDEPSGNRNRGRIPCKDFVRGNCKWGASCRFLHHTSTGDSGDHGGKNASFSRDREHQTSESGRPVCNYFLAGSCQRVNCRFFHECPTASNRENRPHDDGDLVAKSGRYSSTSGEIGKASVRATEWSESLGVNRTYVDRRGRERTWGENQAKEKDSVNVEYPPYKGNEDGRDTGPIRSTITENFTGGREHLASQALESQNTDRISIYAREQNIGQETSNLHFPITTKRAEVSTDSDILQHQNVANAFSFGGLEGGKKSTMAISTVIVPGQSVDQNDAGNLFKPPLVANSYMLPNQTSAQNIDLNGPGQLIHTAFDLPNQIQSHHKEADKTPEMQEHSAPQSFPNFAPTGQDPQIAYHAASLTQNFVNEQLQPHTALNSRTSAHLMSSLQSLVPSLNMTYVQSNSTARPPDHSNLLQDSTELGNSNQPPGSLPHLFEQKIELMLEAFSPLSTGNAEAQNPLEDGSSKAQYDERLKSEQQDATAVSKTEDIHRNDVAEFKENQENIHKKGVNGNSKADDATGNKDDKEMRLFKIALVEFVKEILKPTWKEGRMSREAHKTVVKKVVDKVTSTITADHVPKTHERIEQYLSHSKSKISKLVQAYVERNLKSDA